MRPVRPRAPGTRLGAWHYAQYAATSSDPGSAMMRHSQADGGLWGLMELSSIGSVYRFGLEPESAANLAQQAGKAEQIGFPHGVSVFSRTSRTDAVEAAVADVREHFAIHKTSANPYRYTIELPKPVTDHIARQFNRLFGRIP